MMAWASRKSDARELRVPANLAGRRATALEGTDPIGGSRSARSTDTGHCVKG
jgi:hypothetical protein